MCPSGDLSAAALSALVDASAAINSARGLDETLSAITRRDRELEPVGGWYPNQNVTAEEAVRAYSTWAAWSAFVENETGIIARGRWADLTVMDVDPFVLGSTRPEALLDGSILMTVVAGDVVFER